MTKKRILDVATEEFATLGYSGLSMNKLAEKLKINNNPNIIPLTLREMANFDLGIENNIPNSIEQELVLMKQIILQLNLKEKYKDIDFYELKAMIIGTISSYYSMQKTPLKLSNIKDFDKNDTKILNYVEEFITNILLDALCEN